MHHPQLQIEGLLPVVLAAGFELGLIGLNLALLAFSAVRDFLDLLTPVVIVLDLFRLR